MATLVTNRLHVSASNREVIRAAHKAVSKAYHDRAHREGRFAFYRECLLTHARNQDFYYFSSYRARAAEWARRRK